MALLNLAIFKICIKLITSLKIYLENVRKCKFFMIFSFAKGDEGK